MPLSLFGRRRHKVEVNTPNTYQSGENFTNGAKGFAYISDFNTFPVDLLTRTPLNFLPLRAFPSGDQLLQLSSLPTQTLQGVQFASTDLTGLITQDQYPDVEVPGYGD
jgi:hypothetical protein